MASDCWSQKIKVLCVSFTHRVCRRRRRGRGSQKKNTRIIKCACIGSRGWPLVVGAGGFGPPKLKAADLQSVPFGHSGTLPYGAGERSRTINLLITNQLLCHWATPASQVFISRPTYRTYNIIPHPRVFVKGFLKFYLLSWKNPWKKWYVGSFEQVVLTITDIRTYCGRKFWKKLQ